VPTETRYKHGYNLWRVNSLSADKLYTDWTGSSAASGEGPLKVNETVYWGIRVFKRTSGGVETEIISAGTPVAQVSRSTDGEGIQSATVTISEAIPLNSTDSIIVKVYMKRATGAWAEMNDWTTEQLGASQIDAATWTVYYYTYRNYVFQVMAYYWGDSSLFPCRIEGFKWTPAVVAANPIGDGLTWIVA